MNRSDLDPRRPGPRLPLGTRAGYTLIELLCVVVLVGILAALAVPRVDLGRHRVAAAMEVTGTALLRAQRLAVQRQHNVVFAVDSAAGRLRIHVDRDNDRSIDAGEPVVFEPLGEGVSVGRGAAPALPGASAGIAWRQAGWPAIVFHRNGSASEEGVLYLTTARAAQAGAHPEDARAVRIERSTGRPSWHRFSPPHWQREY